MDSCIFSKVGILDNGMIVIILVVIADIQYSNNI